MTAVSQISTFGTLPDGRVVEAVSLANGPLRATILTWGATLQSLIAPDRDGRMADVAMGFADIDAILADTSYCGASIGRVANRIAGGRFQIDGTDYHVTANDGDHTLHGGPVGFDRQLWRIVDHGTGDDDGAAMVRMAMTSADGDQGFPGELAVTAEWRLTADSRLSLTYQATCDRVTILSMTNHAYWNLAGHDAPENGAADAMAHELMIPADHFLPTDAAAIPTGEVRPVAATPFDFRTPTVIGSRIDTAGDEQLRHGNGYDHNWCLRSALSATPQLACRLRDPASGRSMALYSDHPGLQFYTGNFLDGGPIGKTGQPYPRRWAIALEPQHFPDAANQPAFGSVRLAAGDIYRHQIIWHFTAE